MIFETPQIKRLFGGDGTMGLFVALYLILLAFFILLNSVSEHAALRAVAAMESVKSTFNDPRQVENRPTIDPSAVDIAANDQVLSKISQAFIAKLEIKGRFSTQGGNTFQVQFPADRMFQRGSFRVRGDITPFLDQLVTAVQSAPAGKKQQIAIMFGTGPGPVAREMTRSQEVAVRRAGAIARHLREQGIADGTFTTGFSAIPEGQILAAFWSAPNSSLQGHP